MTELLSIPESKKNSDRKMQIWKDDIFLSYYENYYNNLSSKDLDIDFNRDLKTLVQALRKLNEHDKKAFINVFSSILEHYLEQKISKEIDFSFEKILKF